MPDGVQRKLAAILMADMVGYSRLTEADEAGTLRRLNAVRKETIDPAISQFGGRIVHTSGDGVLCEFPSVIDAVQCAIDIQTTLGQPGKNEPEHMQILYRIGINLGDIIVNGDDIHGNGVNVAARLQTLAEPGSISISETVYDQLGSKKNSEWSDGGECSLKNIERPVRVWHWSLSSEVKTSGSPMKLALPDKPSIAVLPFVNLSNDPDQEFFADGMTEDVITLLATVPDLLVIARNSTFSYKGQSLDIQDVAKELGVRYVLQGSVRKAGNRIRVTAKVVNTPNGRHIWADHYDRDLKDIFAVQDEVAQGIVGVLQSRLLFSESDYISRKPDDKLDAWENLIKARVVAFTYRREELDKAVPLVRRAMSIQPDYAPALALLGAILSWRSTNGWSDDPLGDAREAFKCAKQALEIDFNNPSVLADTSATYATLGLLQKAVPVAERSLQLNPSSAWACANSGWILASVGRTGEGIELARKAFVLSPRDPLEHAFHVCLGSAQYFAGDLNEARRAFKNSLRLKPDLVISHFFLAAILAQEGHCETARLELSRAVQLGSERALENIFRMRTEGTLWRKATDPIREVYKGQLPEPTSKQDLALED